MTTKFAGYSDDTPLSGKGEGESGPAVGRIVHWIDAVKSDRRQSTTDQQFGVQAGAARKEVAF
jgi:hypothetical protein